MAGTVCPPMPEALVAGSAISQCDQLIIDTF